MDKTPIVPRVAVVINLAGGEQAVGRDVALLQYALACHRSLPVSWIVDKAEQIPAVLATSRAEIALAATGRSPQRLRNDLLAAKAGVQSAGGSTTIVAGDPEQLRARASLLADLGFQAVLATAGQARPPRQLPCNLWQLEPSVVIPQSRSRWSLLPRPSLTLPRLAAKVSADQPLIVMVESTALSQREAKQFERLCGELVAAAGQQAIELKSLQQLTSELSKASEVKPQRSILRRAA